MTYMQILRYEVLKAGTILVPKPEWKEFYFKVGWFKHIVTKKEEEGNGTIGERWMIKE